MQSEPENLEVTSAAVIIIALSTYSRKSLTYNSRASISLSDSARKLSIAQERCKLDKIFAELSNLFDMLNSDRLP
jgi:hypothetical protein